jgi:hypothetical protein
MAAGWFRKAAMQRHAEAQYELACLYEHGDGVPQDYKQAVDWYCKAGAQGHLNGQFNAAALYGGGHGIPKDPEQSAMWMRKAADQGDAEAQFRLGTFYASGNGVAQDAQQCAAWHRKAAEQGHAKSQMLLGVMFENGLGVPQDRDQAIFWYRKAAEQGIAEAQQALAAAESGSTASGPRAKLLKAIACVKISGLGAIPEGSVLQLTSSHPGMEMSADQGPVCRASKGAFGVMYMLDEGSHYATVGMPDLREAGMTVEELHEAGLKNLGALSGNEEARLTIKPQGPIWGVFMDGQFDASLVLLDLLWDDAIPRFVPNGIVMTAPARDVCAFCDATSKEGIAALRKLAATVTQKGNHLLSDKLYLRKGQSWVEY